MSPLVMICMVETLMRLMHNSMVIKDIVLDLLLVVVEHLSKFLVV